MGELFHAAIELLCLPLSWVFCWAVLILAGIKRLCSSKRISPAPRHILITGATSGIGRALAEYYAAPGVTLSLTGRNTVALEEVSAAVRAKGATVATRLGDVAGSRAVTEEFAAWIRERDGATPLDLVIANAGATETTLHMEKDLEGAARGLNETNVVGVFNTIFPALERMRARGAGQIAIMSSLASFGALTGSAAYCASKAAVRMLGDSLRAQLAREGIRVTTICPGYVETNMTAASKHAKPFMMGVHAAVRRIASGLAADEANIVFPLPTGLLARIMGSWPGAVREFVGRSRWVPAIAFLRPSKTSAATAAAAAAAAAAATTSAAASGGAAGSASSSAAGSLRGAEAGHGSATAMDGHASGAGKGEGRSSAGGRRRNRSSGADGGHKI